jgi:hypothetical protein
MKLFLEVFVLVDMDSSPDEHESNAVTTISTWREVLTVYARHLMRFRMIAIMHYAIDA